MALLPRPLKLVPGDSSSSLAAEPVTIEGVGTAAAADAAAFVAVDDTPADATAVATDLEALRDALVAAGLMEAS